MDIIAFCCLEIYIAFMYYVIQRITQVPTTISDRSKNKDILWFLLQYPGECMADAMLLNLIGMLLLRPMIRKTDGLK